MRTNCLFGIRCISTGVGGGALRKRQMLSSIKAVVRPSVMVTEKQMEEKMERMKLEHPSKKTGTLDRLVFADPSKTATFNASFLEHVAWAFRVTSHLRNKIAGRGVAITRAEVRRNYEEVRLFWATSQEEKEVETAQVLEGCADELRIAVEVVSDLGQLPKITFVRDLTYLHRSPLDSEFDQIAAELEAAEREETNEELGGEESAQSPKRKHWDAILALEKPTNTLRLERDQIIEQIAQSVANSEASRDPDTIPDPDGPPPLYLGYAPRGDRRANERSVKKLLGNMKKSGILNRDASRK